jgi:hypothetical protein
MINTKRLITVCMGVMVVLLINVCLPAMGGSGATQRNKDSDSFV